MPTDPRDGLETKDRLPFWRMLIASFGGIHEGMSGNVVKNLAGPIFNIGLGMSPGLVGAVIGLPRLIAAFVDPWIGHLSDKTRSRFGRRRPHMFFGAIFSGLFFAALWWFPRGMSHSFYFCYFLAGSVLFYTAAAFFVIPWEALLVELTGGHHERTRLQACRSIVATLGTLALPWLYAATQLSMFSDPIAGVRVVGLVIGVMLLTAGLIPALFLREPETPFAAAVEKRMPLRHGLKEAVRNRPFLLVVGMMVVYGPGFMMTEGLGLYLNIYHVFGGDTRAAAIVQGYYGTVLLASKFIWIPLLTPITRRLGKRQTLMACFALSMSADLLKWFCYTPHHPYLQLVVAAVQAPGMASAWVLLNSMIGDTVDHDELESGHRRAGLFLAIAQWMRMTGITLAFALSGVILSSTGFDVAFGNIQPAATITQMRFYLSVAPAFFTGICFMLAWLYPITEERAHATRLALEDRRRLSPA